MAVIEWLNEQRAIIHIALHILIPLLVALFVARHGNKWFVFFVLMSTMLVDVDHLLATPIYQPDRCSIFFHPLHQTWAIMLYSTMMIGPILLKLLRKPIKPWQKWIGWIGAGLVIHMILDSSDCMWMKVI